MTDDRSTRVVETHASRLFFVDDRVYKVRKPVRFGFLDFRDRDARARDCTREVELNRRLSADVYLGVADVTMDGAPIDHMVVMRRMPDGRRLSALVLDGDASTCLRAVAERLARFHETCERSPAISAHAVGPALRTLWDESFAETEPFAGSVLDGARETAIRSLVPEWLAGRTALLDARIAGGHVCDGHGDLQADDVYCLDDGVRILDCLEFSDRLRHGDVCADVAFLAMDLERIGRPDAAAQFVRDYEHAAGRPFPEGLLHHYIAARAYVRAKVACLRSIQPGGSGAEARPLQSIALRHLRTARVRLVLVGGPPGSGKSTLAAGLGAARGWSVLRSDELRRDLGGPAAASGPGAPAGFRTGRYRPEVTAAVYAGLLDRARDDLGQGVSTVLDASWADAGARREARRLAERTSSELIEIRCDVTPDDADRRIRARARRGDDPSEATPEIAAALRTAADPWPTASPIDTSVLDREQAVAAALVLVDG